MSAFPSPVDAPPSRDAALRARAARVIPNGMWGHMNVDRFAPGYPQFFASADGATVTDVDGRTYVDLMCAWGPMLLGYRHPEVDAAARAQAEKGDAMNGPGEAMVLLAEEFVAQTPHADWALFQKNGADATTTAVTIARATTRRRKLILARGAYHGAVPWCSPSLEGVTAEDRAHLLACDYNDVASLEAAVEAAGGDLAGIILTAFRHDLARDLEMPTLEFARAARRLCDASGAALILDDVRAGLRLHRGGTWELFGVRPDLSCWSKAIANGYPLAAVLGGERFREGAGRIFVTGSFWYGAVAMAAARACLAINRREDVVGHLNAMGLRLRAGLDEIAARHGLPIRQSGPPQMPMLLFEEDADRSKGRAFCLAALQAGAYFHPTHNMFLSFAHQAEHIDRALEAAEAGFRAVKATARARA